MPRRPEPTRRRIGERGFTLIEALVTVAISSVLLAAITSFSLSEQRNLGRRAARAPLLRDLRLALEQIERDVRIAGLDPRRTSGARLTFAAADEIRFTADADGNGAIAATDPAETLGFRRATTGALESFAPDTVGLWLPLVAAVDRTVPVFRYARADGSEVTALPASDATTLGSIRRVDATLTITAGGARRTETVSVWLRNGS